MKIIRTLCQHGFVIYRDFFFVFFYKRKRRALCYIAHFVIISLVAKGIFSLKHYQPLCLGPRL